MQFGPEEHLSPHWSLCRVIGPLEDLVNNRLDRRHRHNLGTGVPWGPLLRLHLATDVFGIRVHISHNLSAEVSEFHRPSTLGSNEKLAPDLALKAADLDREDGLRRLQFGRGLSNRPKGGELGKASQPLQTPRALKRGPDQFGPLSRLPRRGECIIFVTGAASASQWDARFVGPARYCGRAHSAVLGDSGKWSGLVDVLVV